MDEKKSRCKYYLEENDTNVQMNVNCPSLDQIHEYIERYGVGNNVKELVLDNGKRLSTISITEYLKISHESWANAQYFVYGQLPLMTYTPITYDILTSAILKNNESIGNNGIVYNSRECMGVNRHKLLFLNFLEVLRFMGCETPDYTPTY